MDNREALREKILSCHAMKDVHISSLVVLNEYAKIHRLKKGEHLFHDRDTVENIYFVTKGHVSLYKLNYDGSKKVMFVYGAREMLNEVILQNWTASISAEAMGDAEVIYFPQEIFLQVMEADFVFTKAVMDSMAKKIRRLYRQLKNTTGSLRGDRRIAAKLWKLSLDHGCPTKEGVRIDLELSVTYLADMLGAKRETVSRQLKLLLEEGLIIQKNGYFTVVDQDKIKEYFARP
ncbi:CRP/FNR family cyclic AMP-dependent transcriptional regulator [Lachnospiraceae bacterium PF1-21]|uniref:Crp/Fnr family transcriptional regulator n=1 Tax=Ohessyouella blattaphilus TaxID=2949333 RepID=A0ABT1EIU4_9FIRM|nr:Crp/Fnr family transcriptional regulator [Ohessyouella blattaphilus]MCP1109232.1 Crp/Fnr family transcriptional regulator [Ohessyouella blattaphilus]MCR8562626.1 Crp/Fnr family transcriptional regulator [Ohessyouella blattaphilus]